MKHQLQHEDSPTWCVNCGLFDHACRMNEECQGVDGSFDARVSEVFRRMYQSMFPSESVIENLNNFEMGGEG
jgi:hypothetical protein